LSWAHERNRTDKSRSANRYLKRIKYGNPTPRQPDEDLTQRTDWLFEVVFDYGEHDSDKPTPNEGGKWLCRHDPFSSYRAGFEVRTYRLCQRALIFHHFPDEEEVGKDCLVRSTDFVYRNIRDNAEDLRKGHPVASFIASITQTGYKRLPNGGYLKKSLPPLEFEYSQATIHEEVREAGPESLENLPYGLDGTRYQWVDLDGEGVSGILTEQAEGWFYKRNISPASFERQDGRETPVVRFAATELIGQKPSLAEENGGRQQFLDLAGDGSLDLVQFDDPVPGSYERTDDAGWKPFTTFNFLPRLDWDDPNLRFVDLTGDGHADALISEDKVFTWYPSLAEAGFGPAERARKALDEEKGPRLVFADGTQSIHLADMSGDGMTDLVRIRNGEVCYWPSLGYGRFGAKVTMDDAPHLDAPDVFDQRRIRLADIDGSGITDVIYLGRDGVRLYFNQSGNSWSEARTLTQFPHIDNVSAVTAVDLLGNGTACLLWSSPLPGDARRAMRYIDLMGGQKPHLLIKVANNLGAETLVHYAPSTRFYVADKLAGKPWITRLPFPVHVVERVETYDHVSRNRFVTRHAYHHGYFDGEEREFRGFGMVEQFDTEEFAALSATGDFPTGDNVEAASHVPPVLTKTWFHTGVFVGRDRISNFFAGLIDGNDPGEYYREPGLDDQQARALLLEDTVLPDGLSGEEEREACRALKGSILRQEIYALDDTPDAKHPYSVSERNYTLKRLQPRAQNRHAVFFAHPRETIDYHYERNPADPRIGHALTLEVDDFGNVLKSAAIGYGRRQPDMSLPAEDRAKQTQTLITYTENGFTNPVTQTGAYRTPLPCETRSYELSGYTASGAAGRFQFSDFVQPVPNGLTHTFDSEIGYEERPTNARQRRLIEQVRTYYRPDDLGATRNDPLALLPFEQVEALALPGETYKLAFTPGLLAQVYQRPRAGQPPENLLPNPGDVLPADVRGGQVADRGGYVDLDGGGHWWIPSGRVFYSPNSGDTPAQELAYARQHFFLPHRYRDPFGQETTVTYDRHALLVQETRDELDNRMTVQANDYRVLQPRLISDPNDNRSAVAFDALGMVVGTAVMGKSVEPDGRPKGDSLAPFDADLSQQQIDDFFGAQDPHPVTGSLLDTATTRIIYDLDCFHRTRAANPNDPTRWEPVFAATLARETHASDPLPPGGSKIQISFSYSDGFGREIQKKIQAEPERIDGVAGPPRWVGTGWTIFNNKGKPVRQYEPFFTDTHRFEFDTRIGVSPAIFYNPVERVIATLHPNHTYEKVVFDPWRQETWDVNDTVLLDPRTDDDIKGFTGQYFAALAAIPGGWQTWHAARIGGALGPLERAAASKAALHANTPTAVYFDTLGRPFLTLAHNGFRPDGTPVQYPTRVHLDIEGNQREVIDAKGRIVMRYDYDMLGNRIRQASMEAGARWMLNDGMSKPIRAWDSRGHHFRTEYDPLRRPTSQFVRGTDANHSDPRALNREVLFERIEYGEGQANDISLNLRTRVFRQYDGAGIVTNLGRNPATDREEAYDFKGNLLRSSRQLTQDYKALPDWDTPPLMDAPIHRTGTTYDALNRPVTLTTPDNSVIRPTYSEANLLERVEANLRGAAVATAFVTNIDYNAKGQRTRIEYGSGATADRQGVTTTYTYDPFTFRLVHLLTRRNAIVFPGDCPQPPPGGWPGCQVQNLHYTYDPVGNITHIRDDAQQTIYFRNRRVEPSNDYTYDAIYRLIEATGREHLGQNAVGTPLPPAPASYNDKPRVGVLLSANDGNAMGTYLQQYVYDEVGNFLGMIHRGTDPAHPGWRRAYAYIDASLTEPGKFSNRLSETVLHPDGMQPIFEPYSHDAHGNMTRMPHLGGVYPAPNMHWDYRDQLRQTDLGGGGTAYHVYDATGQRVRKVWEKSANLIEERIYLGGFEIYRKRRGAERLERETLHIMDDKRRIALVETRTLDTAGDDLTPPQLIRYQFNNHLGSAILELDDQAQIISYEEYYPYGSTSYQGVRSQTEAPKRYRYTGKERDEQTGLCYHGARYCAPWLGRWLSPDPVGTVDGMNLYEYGRDNPLRFSDPTATVTEDEILQQVISLAREVQAEARNYEKLLPGYTTNVLLARGRGLTALEAQRQKASFEASKLILETAPGKADELLKQLSEARAARVPEVAPGSLSLTDETDPAKVVDYLKRTLVPVAEKAGNLQPLGSVGEELLTTATRVTSPTAGALALIEEAEEAAEGQARRVVREAEDVTRNKEEAIARADKAVARLEKAVARAEKAAAGKSPSLGRRLLGGLRGIFQKLFSFVPGLDFIDPILFKHQAETQGFFEVTPNVRVLTNPRLVPEGSRVYDEGGSPEGTIMGGQLIPYYRAANGNWYPAGA
jgi:RHS repeat-associated protein